MQVTIVCAVYPPGLTQVSRCPIYPFMQPPEKQAKPNLFAEGLPPILLSAFSIDDRQQLLRFVPGALAASGAWLLRHEMASGLIRFIFEFERSNGMNVYVVLVGLGLELTRSSHLALTGFCQRTLNLPGSGTLQVATCELEVHELLEESLSPEPLFGSSSNA